jgi:hypothetical protein
LIDFHQAMQLHKENWYPTIAQNLQDIDDENKETCQKTNIIVAIHITNEQKYCAFELLGIF